MLGDHWHIDNVVQWGEIAGGGSVDRDVRGARTEPRGSPTLRGREKRRNRQRKLRRSKQRRRKKTRDWWTVSWQPIVKRSTKEINRVLY